MRVLVVNAGSSSLKLRVLGAGEAPERAVDLPAGDVPALEAALAGLPPVDAVGHRVVHGGTRFVTPVRVDAAVVAGLRELVELAPLHQPAALDAMDAVGRALGPVPAVACFDTAFHATLPAAATTYALPRAWRERSACGASASTASPTPTPRVARRPRAWCRATSAPAPRWPRCATAAAWTRPWASRRSRVS